MNRCNDCGHEFKEPKSIRERERMDYGIGVTWVTIWEGDVCPECESENFKEIEEEKV